MGSEELMVDSFKVKDKWGNELELYLDQSKPVQKFLAINGTVFEITKSSVKKIIVGLLEEYPNLKEMFAKDKLDVQDNEEEKNPAYYCMTCNTYLGFRGFCSEDCHDQYYDNKDANTNKGVQNGNKN